MNHRLSNSQLTPELVDFAKMSGNPANHFKGGHERTQHSAEMYGIYRVAASRRWVVMIRRQGAVLRKTFGFGPYGGEQAALEHAKRWRDELVRSHPPTQKKILATRPRSHNTSGVAGVFCVFDAKGTPTAWNAKTVLGPGRVLSKNFNIKALGDLNAKRMAVAEREKQLEMMEGFPHVHEGETLARKSEPRALNANLPARLMPGEELRRSSSTGMPGVFLLRFPSGEPKAWKAATLHHGRAIGRAYFSVRKYGFESAKALAIAARQEQLKLKAMDHQGI